LLIEEYLKVRVLDLLNKRTDAQAPKRFAKQKKTRARLVSARLMLIQTINYSKNLLFKQAFCEAVKEEKNA